MKEGGYPLPDPPEPFRVPDATDPAAWNALFARLRKVEARVKELELMLQA
jgi:hypothetical protein